jgi:hypothetical protein
LKILTGEIPLGYIAHADFIQLVVNRGVRPERPNDRHPFKISDALWSLVEACWVGAPQDRPSTSVVCDTLLGILNRTTRTASSVITSSPISRRSSPSTELPHHTSILSLSPSFFPASLNVGSDSRLSFSTSSLISDNSSIIGLSKNENAIVGSVPLSAPGNAVDIIVLEGIGDGPIPSTPQDTSSIATQNSPQPKQLTYPPLSDAKSIPRYPLENTSVGAYNRQKQTRLPHVTRWFRSQQPKTDVSPSESTFTGFSTPNSDFLSPMTNLFSPISHSSAYSSASSIRSGVGTPQMSTISSSSEPLSRSSSRRSPRANGWFWTDQPNTTTRSKIPGQLSSPFRLVHAGQSLPSSGSDTWSLDELLDRWTTRSPGESVEFNSTINFTLPAQISKWTKNFKICF